MGNSEAKSNWEALFNSHDIGFIILSNLYTNSGGVTSNRNVAIAHQQVN
jgi:hypothetical protein